MTQDHIEVLEDQRNKALNQVVNLTADLKAAHRAIGELQSKLDAAESTDESEPDNARN